MDRILSINETYLKNIDIKKIFEYFVSYSEKFKTSIEAQSLKKIETNFSTFVNKAKTLENIYDNCKFVFDYKKIKFDNLILDNEKILIKYFSEKIEKLTNSDIDKIKPLIDNLVKDKNIKFKDFGQPLRIVLTGSKFAPSINDIIQCLGIEEVYKRISLYL